MIPSSPPDALPFVQHTVIHHDGDDDQLPNVWHEDNPSVDYAHTVPSKVYVVWSTLQESRQGCWRSTFRKLVGYFSGGVSHIELAFEFPDTRVIAVAAYQNQNVQLLNRMPERGAYDPVYGKWDWEQIRLDYTERVRAWRFCLFQLGKPYNAWGLYSFIPCLCCIRCCCHDASDGSSWFCSQLVVAAIQHALYENPKLARAAFMVEASACRPDQTLAFLQRLGLVIERTTISVLGDPRKQLAAWWKRESEKV